MRCLALADALASDGASISFVSAAMTDAIAERILDSGHTLHRIPTASELRSSASDWHEHVYSADAQAADFIATSQTGLGDWVVVDHYLLDRQWHSRARSQATVLVIDDLANRSYDCDLLLDPTFGRDRSAYHGRVPANANLLIGNLYSLLRPEFEAERQPALARRKSFEKVQRILISMGTTDLGRITAKIVDGALAAAPDCALDVVIGTGAESLDALTAMAERDTRISLHVDTHDIGGLMRDADLAIGAAGTTSWERCCLGLPSVAVILAENQRPSAVALSEAGAVIAVDRVDEVAPALRSLMEDPERLSRMSAAAFAVVDGRGTQRVASIMVGDTAAEVGKILLRSATRDDADRLWLWRNDPATRAASRNRQPIPWRTHDAWFTDALKDHARMILIAEEAGESVGTVAFLKGAEGAEVSITVAPEARGRDIGPRILDAACREIDRPLLAAVREDNMPSQRLFEGCGFRKTSSLETGFVHYVRADDVLKQGA